MEYQLQFTDKTNAREAMRQLERCGSLVSRKHSILSQHSLAARQKNAIMGPGSVYAESAGGRSDMSVSAGGPYEETATKAKMR